MDCSSNRKETRSLLESRIKLKELMIFYCKPCLIYIKQLEKLSIFFCLEISKSVKTSELKQKVLQSSKQNYSKFIFIHFSYSKMSNSAIQIDTMFSYNLHTNIPWNIPEYEPNRQYLDPEKMKENQQKKARKYKRPTDKVTINEGEKTFFIDELIKPTKNNPSPDKYKTISIFDQKQNKKKSKSVKTNPRSLKYTYLDWIQIEAKERKTPSVGKYNLMKTQKKIKHDLKLLTSKKKFIIQENRHFYDGPQTNTVPGAGNYNPHLSVELPPKPSRKDRHWWIDKHKKLQLHERKKNNKKMAPNSYRPVSASFNSFDKLQINFKKLQKQSKSKKTNPNLGFTSTDSKFEYTRESRVKIKQKRPNANTYDTIIAWKGKNEDSKRGSWVRSVSAGPTRSIYH